MLDIDDMKGSLGEFFHKEVWMQIIGYVLISESSERELQQAVDKALKEGYQPFGTVVIRSDSNSQVSIFYQSMVKYAEPPGEVHWNITL
jgi:hypothetical protein